MQVRRNSAKIQAMSNAARFIRALLLAAVLCAVGRAFSGASTHGQKYELTSHLPKIPVWIGEAERQSQAYSQDAALPPIAGIALGLRNLTSVVIPGTTNVAHLTKGAALNQRPPPAPSSI